MDSLDSKSNLLQDLSRSLCTDVNSKAISTSSLCLLRSHPLLHFDSPLHSWRILCLVRFENSLRSTHQSCSQNGRVWVSVLPELPPLKWGIFYSFQLHCHCLGFESLSTHSFESLCDRGFEQDEWFLIVREKQRNWLSKSCSAFCCEGFKWNQPGGEQAKTVHCEITKGFPLTS